jgi:hypothetical protein
MDQHEIKPDYVNAISSAYPSSSSSSALTENQPRCPDPQQKKFMNERIWLQVPLNQGAAYTQLLTEHHNVLGQASFNAKATTEILHWPSLIDKEPVYVKQSKIPNAHHDAVERQVAGWLL